MASNQRAAKSVVAGIAVLVTLVAWRPAAGVVLPGIHTAPTHVVQLDPLPLEPIGPDYLALAPTVPMVIPGMDAVPAPAEPYHVEWEFSNPNPFAIPAFSAVLVVPGDPPGFGRVMTVPALGLGGATGVMTGAELHFFEPLGPSDMGAFTVTVTSGLSFLIDFDFVLIEWDSALSDPPGIGSGSIVMPPVPIPTVSSVTFTFVAAIIPEPASFVLALTGLAAIGARRTARRRQTDEKRGQKVRTI